MKKLFGLIIMFAFCFELNANNLQIGSPVFTEKNITSGQVKLQFDISWENSWRTDNLNGDGVTNWDAVWLFVKYQKASDGLWYHAALNTTAANHSTGSQAGAAILSPRADGIGAYYYRSANGSGTFSSTSVKLCWNYAADGVGNSLSEEIIGLKVFGIEMVYVPQGAFYVGSGGSEVGHFYAYDSNNPYQITSENEITIGTNNGDLYYQSGSYSGDAAGPIPALFPKGFNAFYCMKYEITQEQYVDFLNILTTEQKSTRFPNEFNNYRHYITLVNGVYGCDGNNNGILDESSDGQTIACNFLSWADGTAYSDWSGLRPMTELEYEKACRGPLTPIVNEYAWGSTSITGATDITNSGDATELTTPTNANCVYENASNVQGPVRVGNFARSGSTRISSGSSYYGIMEMSGNLLERIVTIGNSTGRAYTGNLGNGVLNINGNSDIANCPGGNGLGSGFRGGSLSSTFLIIRVSDRGNAAYASMYRITNGSFRCVGGE